MIQFDESDDMFKIGEQGNLETIASQNYVDEKVANLDGYLPLSGGTMTGPILFTPSVVIKKDTNDGYTQINAATDYAKGAYLYLTGQDTEDAGRFTLGASNNGSIYRLTGKTDGTLTWNGEQLLTSANTIDYKSDIGSITSIAGSFWTDSSNSGITDGLPTEVDSADWVFLQLGMKNGNDKTQIIITGNNIYKRYSDSVLGSETWSNWTDCCFYAPNLSSYTTLTVDTEITVTASGYLLTHVTRGSDNQGYMSIYINGKGFNIYSNDYSHDYLFIPVLKGDTVKYSQTDLTSYYVRLYNRRM